MYAEDIARDILVTGFVRVLDEHELSPGSSRLVNHAGRRVLVVRVGDELRAYDGRCPHANTALADGPLVDGGLIECPMHGALFRASDGALEPGPISCDSLTAWPVRVEDDAIEVDLPEASLAVAGRPQSWGSFGSRSTSGT